MTLALYPLAKLAENTQIPVEQSSFSTITIAYNINSETEVNETLEEAQKAGGKLIKAAEKVFWGGYSGYFLIQTGMAYNPFTPLGPKEEFQWGGV